MEILEAHRIGATRREMQPQRMLAGLFLPVVDDEAPFPPKAHSAIRPHGDDVIAGEHWADPTGPAGAEAFARPPLEGRRRRPIEVDSVIDLLARSVLQRWVREVGGLEPLARGVVAQKLARPAERARGERPPPAPKEIGKVLLRGGGGGEKEVIERVLLRFGLGHPREPFEERTQKALSVLAPQGQEERGREVAAGEAE